MSAIVVRYTGVLKSGKSVGGNAAPISLTAFVEGRFHRGWRELRVLDATGDEVGGISRAMDGCGRIWWACDPAQVTA
jgi:hypothetical protein